MARLLAVHPQHPQPRRVAQAVEVLRQGGVLVYPTDSTYALACALEAREAVERIRAIRRLPPSHLLTLVCRDLSELGAYAHVDNTVYRLLKALTPGPYTFILKATRQVPRRFLHPKRKTVGLRVPDHPVAQALLEALREALGEPLMSTTLQLPGEEGPLTDPWEIKERLDRQVDLVLDAGPGGTEPTTVVDLSGPEPELLRVGLGGAGPFR